MPLKIFISYSHDDRSVANEVFKIIQTDRIEHIACCVDQKDAGHIKCFIDNAEILWGDNVTPSVKQGIQECTDLLVIISERSLKSMWVGYEIGIAHTLGRKILMLLTRHDLKLPSFVSDINYKTCSDLEDVKKYLQMRAAEPLLDEFLERIGHKGDLLYNRIDRVYVPPAELKQIKKVLEDEKLVLIIGPPEFGKTYTAVRLLWEYFKEGYEPQWKSGVELKNIVKEGLRPRQIVYYEDPFGKTEYQRIDDLERQFGVIPSLINRSENSYVIITSPEEAYKEFEEQSAARFTRFETRLKLWTPSYRIRQKEAILLLWAEETDCKWLVNYDLKNFVVNSLDDDKILPTPLSIKNFAISSADDKTDRELKKHIVEQSRATEEVFAREIEQMSADMILFLVFPLVSDRFDVERVRKTYEDLAASSLIRNRTDGDHPWNFDRVFDRLKKDKIELFEDQYPKKTRIRFSHPSYLRALSLVQRQKRFQEILSLLVRPLIRELDSTSHYAYTDLDTGLKPHLDQLKQRFKRQSCEQALSRIGGALDLTLVGLLNDEDLDVRCWAASFLGNKRDLRAVNSLIRALSDEDSRFRTRAAIALGIIGDSNAAGPLMGALADDQPNVRIGAARALGYLHDSQATERLISLLNNDDEPNVRIEAARALGRMADKPAVLALRCALHDKHPCVRRAAGSALVNMGYWLDSLYIGLNDEPWPHRNKSL
jgi:hypothetical protein